MGCLRARDSRNLVEPLLFEAGPKREQLASRCRQLPQRIEGFELYVRVAQLQDHGVGLDRFAGIEKTLLDPPRGQRGNPANLLGHQRPRPPHVDHERAALEIRHQQRPGVDLRGCRLESHEGKAREQHRKGDAHRGDQSPTYAVCLLTWDIHDCL